MKLTKLDEYLISMLLDKYPQYFDSHDFNKVYVGADELGFNEDSLRNFYFWLRENNIDPLDYMTFIPNGFLRTDTVLKHIRIPGNIKTIHQNAFTGSEFESIEIMNPNIVIDNDAFRWCEQIKYVKFNGTLKQLFDNDRLSNKFTMWTKQPKLTIECTDQSIDFDIDKY